MAIIINNMQKHDSSNSSKGNQHEQCKAVTLRSDRPFVSPTVEDKKEEEKIEEKEKDEPIAADLRKYFDPIPAIPSKIPYPQRFRKKNLEAQFLKFLEIFKKLHINIPFVEALEQMLYYIKFMKDVLSRKKKFNKFETVSLIEECRAIL